MKNEVLKRRYSWLMKQATKKQKGTASAGIDAVPGVLKLQHPDRAKWEKVICCMSVTNINRGAESQVLLLTNRNF
ncbi:MAG: hypothetical protein ACE5HO_08805 [bacterium]